ncbi:RNA exonuclease 3 [Didymosphaeria variabile]|uniref:RNA exonuclease 3 n=1 Tax=Didymosphaeria variabile TaxID=1932322 RepID=A0A9W8XHR2_9PLEO|nr:RNA exonuclease 3 [Didymosphaeria variabile]KAJ4351304.1 RNA exonuclease 3 [Didymosphaeria variabile]
MWPSTFSIFKGQACPSVDTCKLPNCLFSHKPSTTPAGSAASHNIELSTNGQPHAKRLRVDSDAVQSTVQAEATLNEVDPLVFTGLRVSKPISKPTSTPSKQQTVTAQASTQPPTDAETNHALPRTATRPVSPPPSKASTEARTQPEKEVSLFPRKLQNEPAPFQARLARLKMLHDFMVPFNNKLLSAKNPATKALHLSANQLRKLAVDEEAKIAIEHRSIYDNVIKHHIVAYKKMSQEDWVKARREAVAKDREELPKKPPPKKVETGMTLKEEVIFLSTMLAPQSSLEAHGFVTKDPTDSEIEECRQTQILSDFWEVCDRCRTRFQAFPDRREEDGAVTVGGKCRYHWGKRVWPKRERGKDPEPAKWACCNETVGTEGCTESDTHVYKFTDVKRMSLAMRFIETPENDKVEPHTAVCFDCEMGYTTQGFELLRLTVIDWPSHRPLIDVLVRPLGFILDLNTQWSGVTMDQFINAKPYDPANPKPKRTDLRIVESPYAARELFLAHVSPTTPVLGHALENDLNVIRLIHPTIVDTVILYPTKSGLPYRHSLKTLAKQFLGIDIQQGGASGHDSYEDARTTGELVRSKVGYRWKQLKYEGWTISEDGVYPPLPAGLPPPSIPATPSMIPRPITVNTSYSTTTKRKLEDCEGYEDDSLEEPLNANGGTTTKQLFLYENDNLDEPIR